MDSHSDLVDVLLLSDYSIYERYPELVQRVDYFLYEWTEEMLTRTESLLRKKSRSVRNIETNKERLYTNNGEGEAFTHARSLNIAWRQFAVGRLQLPRYPPERINWNKDADPASAAIVSQLKPRLRFNNSVEQCMVVFKQEKEYLPTDYEEDDSADENDASYYRYSSGGGSSNSKRTPPLVARRSHGSSSSSSSKSCGHNRRTLVIKLAPAHLKGDHRKLIAVSAPAALAASPSTYREYLYSADSDDDAADYFDTFNGGRSTSTTAKRSISGTSGGVSGYVQGCVQSVAGQVRRFVSDAVSVSAFGADRAKSQPLHSAYVSDPFAPHLKHSSRSSSAPSVCTQSHGSSTLQAATEHSVVRDPFSLAPPSNNPTMSADHMLFDDDEDAIIQEFEREMQKYGSTDATAEATRPALALPPPSLFRRYDYANDNNCAAVVAPGCSAWDDDDDYACDYDMYGNEYQLRRDDYGYSQQHKVLPRATTEVGAGLASSASAIGGAAQPPAQRGRNDSIIDRAEDTIVNTVDAVKWCASFITNYTIF
ncbi:hypothetical protein GGI20_002482 [Coemansia sp. BCRC 34301]|nr:hypothetical protein GGI20_002482 [Coemansia sp. BCRC 34301]